MAGRLRRPGQLTGDLSWPGAGHGPERDEAAGGGRPADRRVQPVVPLDAVHYRDAGVSGREGRRPRGPDPPRARRAKCSAEQAETHSGWPEGQQFQRPLLGR